MPPVFIYRTVTPGGPSRVGRSVRPVPVAADFTPVFVDVVHPSLRSRPGGSVA